MCWVGCHPTLAAIGHWCKQYGGHSEKKTVMFCLSLMKKCETELFEKEDDCLTGKKKEISMEFQEYELSSK